MNSERTPLSKSIAQMHDIHPLYQENLLLKTYSNTISKIAEDNKIRIPDFNAPILYGNEEKGLLTDLVFVIYESEQTLDFDNIVDGIKKVANGSRASVESNGAEYMFLIKVLEDGLLPILESPTFATEYRLNKRSFFTLIKEIVHSFVSSNRAMLAFHSGEVFKSKEIYDSGKNLGIVNASILGLRDFVRKI